MKLPLVIITLLLSLNLFAKSYGGPNDSTFFINFNIGVNGFSNNASTQNAYGISVSESAFTVGPFVSLGWEYRMKKGLGFHIDAAANFASRNKKRFIQNFEEYYATYDVNYKTTNFSGKPSILGGLFYTTEVGLSYLFRFDKIAMFPRMSFGWQSAVNHNYNFSLRNVGTNYFTNYEVSNTVEWSPYYSAGFSVLLGKYDLAAITAELGTSKMKNNYAVVEYSLNEPLIENSISTEHYKVFWKLSLTLRMDFAFMK